MMRIRAFTIVAVVVSPLLAKAQAVSGTILSRTSGNVVADAHVVLMGTDGRLKATVLSDAVGRYVILAPSEGTYRMLVAASGFDPAEVPEFRLDHGQVTAMDVKISVAQPAAKLEKITVTAERPIATAPAGNPHKFDDFLLRRKMGIGTFLTREQIEARPHSQTPQILQGIPGLKVIQHGTTWFIRSQRCPSFIGGGGPGSDINMDEDNPFFPILFIDGFRVKGLSTLLTINPSEIEAIEVYQGAAQLPANAKGNACAAIYVWLRGAN